MPTVPDGVAEVGRNQRTHACPWSIGSAVPRRANHCDSVTPAHLSGSKAGSGPPPGRKFLQCIERESLPGSAAEPTFTEREILVSTEQRETLDAVLRQSAFPADSDVSE